MGVEGRPPTPDHEPSLGGRWDPHGSRPAVRRRAPSRRALLGLRTLLTLAVLAAAYLLAFELRFEFAVPPRFRMTAWLTVVPVVTVKYLLLRAVGSERHSWRYTSLWEVVAVAAAMAGATVLLLITRFALPAASELLGATPLATIPLGVIAIDLALSVLLLVGARGVRRLQVEQRELRRRQLRADRAATPPRRVVLLGAGRMGASVARDLQARPDLGLVPVGFLDDDPARHGQRLQGLDILGGLDDLEGVVADHHVEQAVIALADAAGPTVRELVRRCREAGIDVTIVPAIQEVVDGQVELARVRPVRMDDLLRRTPVELDTSAIASLVAGRCVLVTGAGGSIGSELCRQLLAFRPRRLVLVERAEGALWAAERELRQRLAGSPGETSPVELEAVLADVGDRERVEQVLAAHRPTLVFHAAAHKHVPLVEDNPHEAVRNNVLGTRVLATAAAAAGVDRFVLISTDKAVNPTSVMGVTKRLAERYVQYLAARTGRAYLSVRFGNVLGSAGSVLPVFEEQIAAGGPVTVTHPDMRRYFMTIPEAGALVVQAAAVGQPGEVLVLDMGEQLSIVELAEDLIRLSGFLPHEEIAITYTGIRPGEKLTEELALDAEHTDRTAHPSVLVARTEDRWPDADHDLDRLARVAARGTVAQLRQTLQELLPEGERGRDLPGPSTVEEATCARS